MNINRASCKYIANWLISLCRYKYEALHTYLPEDNKHFQVFDKVICYLFCHFDNVKARRKVQLRYFSQSFEKLLHIHQQMPLTKA